MATHSSVLAWRSPGTGEPGGLPSIGSHRVGHDWSDLAAAAAAEVWNALPPPHSLSSSLSYLSPLLSSQRPSPTSQAASPSSTAPIYFLGSTSHNRYLPCLLIYLVRISRKGATSLMLIHSSRPDLPEALAHSQCSMCWMDSWVSEEMDEWINEQSTTQTESLEYRRPDLLCFTIWHNAVSFSVWEFLMTLLSISFFFFFFLNSWQKCQGEERHRFTGWMENRTWQGCSFSLLPTPSQSKSQEIGRVFGKQSPELFLAVSPCSLRDWDAPSVGSRRGYDGWIHETPSPLCFPPPKAGSTQPLLCPPALPPHTATLGCLA